MANLSFVTYLQHLHMKSSYYTQTLHSIFGLILQQRCSFVYKDPNYFRTGLIRGLQQIILIEIVQL